METKTKVLALAAAGLLGVVGMFGAGAYYMVTHGGVKVGGDMRSALDTDYEPTSEWIEEGLDPDVTTFGFEGKDNGPKGPELSEYDIQQQVRGKQNDLMACYAAALEEEDLQGTVDFQFGIAPDGHVAMVKVTGSTLESKSTEDCMVSKARSWSFPRTNRSTLMKFDTDFTFVYE